MSEDTQTKEIEKKDEEKSVAEDRDSGCCYVVDRCGCYVDPCCSPSYVYCC
jgi:hypothetical protein